MSDRTRRTAASAVSFFLFLLALPLQGQSDDASLRRLHTEIERLATGTEGVVGVSVLHLESGAALSLNGDVAFPMASTYKIPIATQLMYRVDAGMLRLDTLIEVTAADLHPGSGTLTALFDDPGVILSARNLMELMLLISDNSATDLTLRLAGGPAAVTRRMHDIGIRGIRVDRPTSSLIADFIGVRGVPENGSVTPDDFTVMVDALPSDSVAAAAERFATDPRDTATPDAMARLLVGIWRAEVVSQASRDTLVDVLERVSTGAGRLRGMLPPDVVVAHKTGTIGATTNDVGIIELPADAGNVVTVVFVKDAPEPIPVRERVIAQIARAVYDYFVFVPQHAR